MLSNYSQQELEQGWHRQADTFYCNYCDTKFEADQVYQINDHFFAAAAAIEQHIQNVHQGNAYQLIHDDSKYNQLTEKQQDLLTAFATGQKDADIARDMNVSASTIRHQKFTFREKAKQAKQYLAMYHNVFEINHDQSDTLIPIPGHVARPDDRFAITNAEWQNTVAEYLSETNGQLTLKRLPRKQKRIVVVLDRITQSLPADGEWDELQITAILKKISDDPVTLRRYLIEYGFMDRTRDGSRYWIVKD